MKLRNKKTGEIIDAESCNNASGCISIYYEEKDGQIGTKDCYSSLAELNEEWEDAPDEKPKEYYYLDNCGDILQDVDDDSSVDRIRKEIGNHFETKEEAEKAVEKLKAWKRLKDKGFRFDGWYTNYGHHRATFVFDKEAWATEVKPDLDLLFGGEE